MEGEVDGGMAAEYECDFCGSEIGVESVETITGGERIVDVPVHPINDATDWGMDAQGNPTLKLTVDEPGDFSYYTLTLNSTTLDDYFKRAGSGFCIQPCGLHHVREDGVVPLDFVPGPSKHIGQRLDAELRADL